MSETKTKTPNAYKWKLPLLQPDPDSKREYAMFTLNEPLGRITRPFQKLQDESIRMGELADNVATHIVRIGDEMKRLPLSLAHEKELSSDDDGYDEALFEPPAKLASLQLLLDKKYEQLTKIKEDVQKNIEERFLTSIKVINRDKGQENLTVSDVDLEEIGRDQMVEIIGFFNQKSDGILPKLNDSN
jgi:hypothetical protein